MGPRVRISQGRAWTSKTYCPGGPIDTAAFVGIDVSKATLEVAVRPSGERFSVPNDEAGIVEPLERLRAHPADLVMLEATGGFENATVAALATQGFAVVVANSRQIRDFPRATGTIR